MVVEDVCHEAGLGRRGPVEALEHVGNQPIASHVVDVLRSAGVDEITLVTSEPLAGAVAECIAPSCASAGLGLRHVTQAGPVDLPGALGVVAPMLGSDPCIVHTASGLLGEPLGTFAERLRPDQPDVTVFVHQGTAADGHLNAATQEMLHLAELDPEHAALGLAGVWLFGPDALQLVAGDPWRVARDVDLTTVAGQVTGNGGKFDVVPVDAWRSYAGDTLDLLELNRIALDRLQADLRRPRHNGNQIEGRVWIHESASVRSSVIVGPAVIGAGARIADAYIGPYTSIGAGAHIEGAEVERSIIFSGASILHVGGRIVSSVVGRDARVFRDFSLPRALRLRVGDGTEVALC
jgi:glucose-1-phosphate thymidylyltransferase